MKIEKFASPALSCVPTLLTDTRSGVIARIIEANGTTIARYVLQTNDGLQFCVQSDIAAHVSRNELLMLAFQSCLPVTVAADIYGQATGVAIGAGGSTKPPVLNCGGTPLSSQRTGLLVQVFDQLTSGNLNYTLQTPDGVQYCALHSPGDLSDINKLLLNAALTLNLNITAIGGGNTYITDLAVGNKGTPTPSLDCGSAQLVNITRSGTVVRIIKRNSLWQVNYVIRDQAGVEWCSQTDPTETTKLNALLVALTTGMSVTLKGDANAHITQLALGR